MAPSIKISLSFLFLFIPLPTKPSQPFTFPFPIPSLLPLSQITQKILSISSSWVPLCVSLLGSLFLNLTSLGFWIVAWLAWLSFVLCLISTYEWVHAMFIFLGLGYLTQDDFFLVPSICLQISRCHCFLLGEILHCVNIPHFLYSFFRWNGI